MQQNNHKEDKSEWYANNKTNMPFELSYTIQFFYFRVMQQKTEFFIFCYKATSLFFLSKILFGVKLQKFQTFWSYVLWNYFWRENSNIEYSTFFGNLKDFKFIWIFAPKLDKCNFRHKNSCICKIILGAKIQIRWFFFQIFEFEFSRQIWILQQIQFLA